MAFEFRFGGVRVLRVLIPWGLEIRFTMDFGLKVGALLLLDPEGGPMVSLVDEPFWDAVQWG